LKIAVCLKRVPEMELRFSIAADRKSLDQAGLKYEMGDFDGYALEVGLQLVEKAGSGEVVAVCLGPDGVIEIAGHNVPVIDSTGAGDCFVGAFAAGFVVDRDLKRALLLANAAAAISVQRAGAGSSMPMRAEVIEQFGL